jgi:hypothetical protein
VSFSHGEGLYASRLEPEIEVHAAVKSALIGGLDPYAQDARSTDQKSGNDQDVDIGGKSTVVWNLVRYIDLSYPGCANYWQHRIRRIPYISSR